MIAPGPSQKRISSGRKCNHYELFCRLVSPLPSNGTTSFYFFFTISCRELHEQLIRVSQLIQSQRGDAVDKDVRIEELTFENRALRQNAIDEKEVIVMRLLI